ncbi:hypothetical protein VNI00_014500 [Paramarasmius palmivorus]|uniref:Heterokaryon incompatibility domain-containing protein n=1 Tax=Paramarasmius palmivorus TaxID=297713 RepID=A0AAW0BSK3_9AGAR
MKPSPGEHSFQPSFSAQHIPDTGHPYSDRVPPTSLSNVLGLHKTKATCTSRRRTLSSDLPRSPPASAVCRHIFRPTPWLGGKHDGNPLLSFKDYGSKSSHCTSIEEHAAHAQCHLTFGLLEAVMEVKLSENLLLSHQGGHVLLIDDHLPNLLADWRSRIRRLSKHDIDECRQWAQRVEETLSTAKRLLLLEITQPRHSPFRLARVPCETHHAILLAIAAIGEALTSSRRMFPCAFPRISWSFIFSLTKLHHEDMLKNGWCPFVTRIVGDSGVCALGYASTRKPFVCDSTGCGGHAKCSKEACVINNIDSSTYRNRHVETSCECAFIAPPQESVLEILQSGEIPVMRYDSGANELSVHRASDLSYVAISHVWVDGMGSTTEIGLPTCQIRGLAGKVNEIAPTNAFWMDSLCVPEKRELRKQAIGLMAKTYRDATAVLVLDSGIRHCSVSAPLEEKLLSVISSGWMQRLWTLQEGLLAQRLIFSFADGLMNLDDLIPVGEDLLDCLLTELCTEIFRLTKYRTDSASFGIGDLARSLVWRTTSKAEDETLAIAGLANVDAKELVSMPPEERMKAFLLRVRKLPPDIIFMSVPKLKDPGFSWAPQTLMQRGAAVMAVSKYEAVCTPNGLLAEYAAVVFPQQTIQNDTQWFLFDASRKCYYKATVVANPDKEETYSCDALLMVRLPRSAELMGCAAVLVAGVNAEEKGDRMVCEYRQRLLLQEIPEFRVQQEKPADVVMASSGRMMTRVV